MRSLALAVVLLPVALVVHSAAASDAPPVGDAAPPAVATPATSGGATDPKACACGGPVGTKCCNPAAEGAAEATEGTKSEPGCGCKKAKQARQSP